MCVGSKFVWLFLNYPRKRENNALLLFLLFVACDNPFNAYIQSFMLPHFLPTTFKYKRLSAQDNSLKKSLTHMRNWHIYLTQRLRQDCVKNQQMLVSYSRNKEISFTPQLQSKSFNRFKDISKFDPIKWSLISPPPPIWSIKSKTSKNWRFKRL